MKNLQKKKSELSDHIREIMLLDCRSLPIRIEEPSNVGGSSTRSTPGNRLRTNKVASVAAIRILLVALGNLHTHLSGILKVTAISPFYNERRQLIDRVLPESLFAFEYCRETLSLKGATDSPNAAKLATIANSIGDCIEALRARVNLSMEYYELKFGVLEEISQYTLREEFSQSDCGPLMFSLTVSLPPRLEAFKESASKHFPEAVSHLYKLSDEATQRARQKVESFKQAEEDAREDARLAGNAHRDSPVRPKLQVLRGVKYRQPLRQFHQRIPSLKDMMLSQQTNDLDENKENPSMDSPKQFLSPNQRFSPKQHLSPDQRFSSKQLLSPKPHLSPKQYRSPKQLSISRIRPSASRGFAASTGAPSTHSARKDAGPKKDENTLLKRPTRIENRKLIRPNTSCVPTLRPMASTASLTSKIARPTEIRPCRSTNQLRNSDMSISRHRRSGSLSSNGDSFESSFSTNFSDTSRLLLSSPESSMIEETPLSRKGAHVTTHFSLLHQRRSSSANLQIARTRRTNMVSH